MPDRARLETAQRLLQMAMDLLEEERRELLPERTPIDEALKEARAEGYREGRAGTRGDGLPSGPVDLSRPSPSMLEENQLPIRYDDSERLV